LVVPVYGWACFGSPFAVGYDHTAYKEMHSGFYGLQWPSWFVLSKYMFSPSRGLLYWCPFLALALLGLPALVRKDRAVFVLVMSVSLAHVAAMAGKRWDWQAGFTLGPRYLAPVVPFLMLPAALGFSRFRFLGSTLAGLSVAMTTLATLVDPAPDYSVTNPLTELHVPGFLGGEFAQNAGHALGLHSYWSTVPFCIGVLCFWFALKSELTRNTPDGADHPFPDA
jgi:hypothetical protein